jgi:hypothetical protein
MVRGTTSAAGFATDGARGPSRPRRRHVWAIGLSVVALVGGCGPAVPSGSGLVAFDDEGLRVALPVGWAAMRAGDVGHGNGRVLFYLSNQDMHGDCRDEGGQQFCWFPVDSLSAEGVLVIWSTSNCAGTACDLPDDERRLISGREAATTDETGMCFHIAATDESVYAVTVTPQRVDWIVVCAHTPGPVQRGEIASILDGVEWLTP